MSTSSKNPIVRAEYMNGSHLGKTVEFEARLSTTGRGPLLDNEDAPGVWATVRGILNAVAHDVSTFAPVILTLTWPGADSRVGSLQFPLTTATMVTVVEDEEAV